MKKRRHPAEPSEEEEGVCRCLRERTEAMAAARKEKISMQVQQQESESKRHQEI